jgi:hypothetical protein
MNDSLRATEIIEDDSAQLLDVEPAAEHMPAEQEITLPRTPADVVQRTREVGKAVTKETMRMQLDKLEEEATKQRLSPEEIRILKRDAVVRAMSGRRLATRTITRL